MSYGNYGNDNHTGSERRGNPNDIGSDSYETSGRDTDNFGSSNADNFSSSGRTVGEGDFGSPRQDNEILGSTGQTGGSDSYGPSRAKTGTFGSSGGDNFGSSGHAGGGLTGFDSYGVTSTGGVGNDDCFGSLQRASQRDDEVEDLGSSGGTRGVGLNSSDTGVANDNLGSEPLDSGSTGSHGMEERNGHSGHSVLGKFIEKAGDMLNNDKLEQKGRERREQTGSRGYPDSDDP